MVEALLLSRYEMEVQFILTQDTPAKELNRAIEDTGLGVEEVKWLPETRILPEGKARAKISFLSDSTLGAYLVDYFRSIFRYSYGCSVISMRVPRRGKGTNYPVSSTRAAAAAAPPKIQQQSPEMDILTAGLLEMETMTRDNIKNKKTITKLQEDLTHRIAPFTTSTTGWKQEDLVPVLPVIRNKGGPGYVVSTHSFVRPQLAASHWRLFEGGPRLSFVVDSEAGMYVLANKGERGTPYAAATDSFAGLT